MRRRGFISAILLTAVFLLTAGYFLLTGSFFLTKILMPWISNAAGCEITVRHVVLRPFSRRIILRDFRMGIREQPFLTVQRARGTLLFLPLLRGRLEFSDVELTQAKLRVARDAHGAWCRHELGNAFFQDEGEDSIPSSGETAFRLCLHRTHIENSTIEIAVDDAQRKFRMLFTDFSGIAENYCNDGTMTLKCVSRIHADGRPGLSLNGFAEWNGKLSWDDDFSLNGAHGCLSLPYLTGVLDGTHLPGAELRGMIQAHRPRNERWDFQHLQLLRMDRHGVTDMMELSGYCRPEPLQYELDIQRAHMSGTFLSILSELSRGIRPGEMQLSASGKISGNSEHFHSTLQGTVARQAGPAYFGGEKIMLPEFRLTLAHDLGFNWQTNRITVNKLDTQLFSNGKLQLQTACSPDQILNCRIQNLDMPLLRLFVPTIYGFAAESGLLSGSGRFRIAHGPHADTISGQAEFSGSGIRISRDGNIGRKFDSSISAKINLPLKSGLLKVSPLQMEINHKKGLHASIEGSIPLHSGHASLFWQLTADPENLLPLLNIQSADENMPYLSAFSPLQLTGSGKLSFSPEAILLQQHRFALIGKGGSSAVATLQEHRHQRYRTQRVPWRWTLSAAVPSAQLPFSGSTLQLTGGKCQIQGTLENRTDFSNWLFSGNLSWQDISGRLFGKSFADSSGSVEFNTYGNQDGDFALGRASARCRIRGNPVLRIESYGDGNFRKGNFSSTTTLRYANETLLNLLLPWKLTGGQCTGSLQINGNWMTQQYSGNGYAALRQLKTPETTKQSNGDLTFQFRKETESPLIPQCKLNLTQEDGAGIADITLVRQPPDKNSTGIKLLLTSKELDLAKLCAMFDDRSGSMNSGHTVMDCKGQPIQIELLLGKLYWDPDDPLAIQGKIHLHRNRIRIPQILCSLGGGKLEFKADGMDFPTGMMLDVSIRQRSPVNLKPIIALCFPESRLTGMLQELSCDLKFRRLYTSRWREDLVARGRMQFRDLNLPIDSASGPLSRILLLPVETMIRAGKAIPSTKNISKHFQQLKQAKFDPQSPFANLKFSEGELQLQADNGRLNIQKMEFSGTPISRLSAAGYTAMQEKGELKLDFDITLSGIRARIPVRGTMDAPDIAAWQLFGMIPGTWSDMLGFSNGTVKPLKPPNTFPLQELMQQLPKMFRNSAP